MSKSFWFARCNRTPNRRWFRFGLRGLFVAVAVVALGLALTIERVHRRRTMAQRIEADGGLAEAWIRPQPLKLSGANLTLEITSYQRVHGPESEPQIPAWRRWLGDEAYNQIILPVGWNESDLRRARSLFPEARVEPAIERSSGSGLF